MKHILKNKWIIGLSMTGLIFLSGCYEGHYYHRYHHHSRPWYEHHHQPPPPGVNFEMDVR